MAQTDYIMRIIEQFADFLWAIVLNKKAQNYDFALEKINEAYNGLLYLNADKIKNLSANEILENNTHKGSLDKNNIEIIANLLFEEADILENINGNNIVSFEYYQKSIELFIKLVNETAKTQYCENIEEINTLLERKGAVTKNEIMGFYEILLKRDDVDLEKGNLPRTEIIEAIKALE